MLGRRGEDAAAAWYEAGGYVVVDRNWRCAQGELDLVATGVDGGVVVFCEVKTRASGTFGSPFEAVTPAKQRRVRMVAARWLRRAGRGAARYAHVRFDVAAVTATPGGALEVEVLEDAF